MQDKYFIDSNILVYAHDVSEGNRHKISKDIILCGIENSNIVISTQVLSEFFVTVTKKIKRTLAIETAKKEIMLLKCVEVVEIDVDMIVKAIEALQKYSLSYWDALIISSAIRSNCAAVYSEDLNAGQVIESIKIINPFI